MPLLVARPTEWFAVVGSWSGDLQGRQLVSLGRGEDTARWRLIKAYLLGTA